MSGRCMSLQFCLTTERVAEEVRRTGRKEGGNYYYPGLKDTAAATGEFGINNEMRVYERER